MCLRTKTSTPGQGPIFSKTNGDIPAAMMTSLFAFTVYFCPPDTNSTASASLGALLSSESVLGLNRILVASAPVSTTRFFLLAFGSKYPVSEEDRVPDRGSTALAGVKKPVALPVSYGNKVQVRE